MVTAAACRARLSRQARSEPLSKRTLATTEAATLRQNDYHQAIVNGQPGRRNHDREANGF